MTSELLPILPPAEDYTKHKFQQANCLSSWEGVIAGLDQDGISLTFVKNVSLFNQPDMSSVVWLIL